LTPGKAVGQLYKFKTVQLLTLSYYAT